MIWYLERKQNNTQQSSHAQSSISLAEWKGALRFGIQKEHVEEVLLEESSEAETL